MEIAVGSRREAQRIIAGVEQKEKLDEEAVRRPETEATNV